MNFKEPTNRNYNYKCFETYIGFGIKTEYEFYIDLLDKNFVSTSLDVYNNKIRYMQSVNSKSKEIVADKLKGYTI
jgi:hypothetical protein